MNLEVGVIHQFGGCASEFMLSLVPRPKRAYIVSVPSMDNQCFFNTISLGLCDENVWKLDSDQRKLITLATKKQRLNVRCLLYTSPSPRDRQKSRMPSSA